MCHICHLEKHFISFYHSFCNDCICQVFKHLKYTKVSRARRIYNKIMCFFSVNLNLEAEGKIPLKEK